MARRALREPRFASPALPTIGVQPDMFGGPTVVHEPRPVRALCCKQLRAYHLADHFADLEDGQ